MTAEQTTVFRNITREQYEALYKNEQLCLIKNTHANGAIEIWGFLPTDNEREVLKILRTVALGEGLPFMFDESKTTAVRKRKGKYWSSIHITDAVAPTGYIYGTYIYHDLAKTTLTA